METQEQLTRTGTTVPGQRRAADGEGSSTTGPAVVAAPAAPAAPVSGWESHGWGTVVRVSLSRAAIAVVVSLLVWSVLPMALGWAPRVILSGSMEPLVHTGDVVVTRTVDPSLLERGDVVTTVDPDKAGKTRTHRYVQRDADGLIVTKGDANREQDSTPVADDAVLGQGVLRVPYVGLPAYWMAERDTLALGLGFAALSALVLGAWSPTRTAPTDGTGGPTRDGGAGDQGAHRPDRRVRARGLRGRRAGAVVTLSLLAAAVAGVALPQGSYAAFSGQAANKASSLAAATVFRPYQDAVVADAPTFYWKLDETSGTAIADSSSGTKLAGTLLSQTSAWVASTALAEQPQRGLDVSAAVLNASSSVSGTSAFTVEAWFKTTSTAGGRLLGFGNNGGNQASTTVDRQLYVGSNGRVYFGVGANRTVVPSTASLRDGQWHHVVGTYTTGNGGMKLYVDGALQGSATATVNSGLTTGFWRAAAESMSSWTANPTSQYFAGSLDELAVYPRVLSAAEVSEHWTKSAG